MWKEFREFIARGSMIDMAVGIILGGAFGTAIKSLVNDLLMPLVGLLLGRIDFINLFVVLQEGVTAGPYSTLSAAQEAGAITLNLGLFINAIIAFLITSLALFLLIKGVNQIRREEEPEALPPDPPSKECPHCLSSILQAATRCKYCTSELG